MVFVYPASMLDEEFRKQRASLVRDLASRADPFIKKRLLALASRYEDTKPGRRSFRSTTRIVPAARRAAVVPADDLGRINADVAG
jgi:hypothetical protein